MIPFTYDSTCAEIREREQAGKHFTLVIVAEDAREKGGEFVIAGEQLANREARLGGIAELVSREIEIRTGKEARACVLGHLQRGGSPTNFDARRVTIVAQMRPGQMTHRAPKAAGAGSHSPLKLCGIFEVNTDTDQHGRQT